MIGRQEILTLEYHLLQNAVECQKNLAAIKEWERQHNSLSTLPTSLTSLEPLSPSTISESVHQRAKQPHPLAHDSQAEESSTEEEQFSDTYVDSSYSRPSSKTDDPKTKGLTKEESKLFLPAFRPPIDEQIITPDSGTCTAVPADLEPLWVCRAREEVATLEADSQRMEAHHSQLQERLIENSAKKTAVKEVSCTLNFDFILHAPIFINNVFTENL